MGHWDDKDDEECFAQLEHKAKEIRKTLFGVLLLAKELWKEELSQRPEGAEIVEAIETAEDSFPDISEPNKGKRLKQTMDVINKRAKSIFGVMSYVSKNK